MYEVRPSAIHGQGLFASHFIPAGTELGRLIGRWTDRDGPYVLWIDETRGLKVVNDLRFINHSAAPNAVYYDDLTVVALCDIEAGEEITHNYQGDEADESDAPLDWDEPEAAAVP